LNYVIANGQKFSGLGARNQLFCDWGFRSGGFMVRTGISYVATSFLVVSIFSISSFSRADTFGSGVNSFEIEFVPIGDPGNAADTTGFPNPAGGVDYRYRMGKFEISEQMIEKANALGNLGITKDTRGPDKPATSITWFEAAKFVNWLNEDAGFYPAYKFVEIIGRGGQVVGTEFALWESGDQGYNSDNLFRNRLARYVLPSADEWHKAAYYDPTTSAGTWYDYPTGSDAPPTAVASGTDPGTAVFGQDLSAGPADIMNAGGLSPFGTMAQGGNVFEWEESEVDLINDNASSRRGFRGGFWEHSSLSASSRGDGPPEVGLFGVGFRIVSIPEPCGLFLIGPTLLRFIFLRRRAK
jgi:sulfatase modifying factor 1